MMSNFTKGEWFAKREGQSTVYIECRIGGGWLQEVAACGPTANGSEEQEANAKLIASAPDLLEALQMAREMLNRNLPTLDRNVGFCPNIVSATVAAIGVVDIAIAKALA